ncbi:MAG TPA: ATP-binding protein [Syntrophorhabdaceae bacterium]|nr:ATP-binding protein [Syntrophorhabdaceae bacterium]HPU29434.1 ATP-binding protein [Syntrophorhabdaceae bacterium]
MNIGLKTRLIEPVYMIVLTGGPCSGKSSSLAYLTEKLSDHGFMVFIIPETATLITNSGIDRRKMERSKQVSAYEEAIFDMQIAFEDIYKESVMKVFPDKKKVVLLDRGIMDIKAFMPEKDFSDILKRKKITEIELRDRYSGVIHLITAADGAKRYYTNQNNPARIETPEEAIEIDKKIRECWLGHPRLKIIDNSTDFEEKLNRTFTAIANILGIPSPLPITEKFLVESFEEDMLPAHQTIHIEKIYLKSKNKDEREKIIIKKRGQNNRYLYFLSRKGITVEDEILTEHEYLTLKRLMDPKTHILIKERKCFFWNNQYCELDVYKGEKGISILTLEPLYGISNDNDVEVPPFIRAYKKITGMPEFDEDNLALNKSRKKLFIKPLNPEA